MRRTLRRLAAVFSLAALGTAAACSDSPTTGQVAKDEAKLGFSINVANTAVQTLVVEVTAPDITSRLVFNVPVNNGVANGSITVPAGNGRTVAVRAYDAQGTLTHEGSTTVNVRPGANVSIAITLVPRAGQLPITVNFGSLYVSILRQTPIRPAGDVVGDTVRFLGHVMDPDAQTVAGTVRWATLDPSIATVDSTGLVTARGVGSTEIVGTYGGFGSSVIVTVAAGSGSGGGPDTTAPQVTGMNFVPDTLYVAQGDTAVTLSFDVYETGAGVIYAAMDIQGPSGSPAQRRPCSVYPTGPGSPTAFTLTCTYHLSRHSAPGVWSFAGGAIEDRAGNGRYVDPTEAAAAGWDVDFVVVNPTPDTQPPALTAAYFDRATVGVYETAFLTLSPTDDSGIRELRADIGTSSSTGVSASMNCNAHELPGAGNWMCEFNFADYLPAGEYRLKGVLITDLADNERYYSREELEELMITPAITFNK
jgi:Bacterial Ig-like domain (group 2)